MAMGHLTPSITGSDRCKQGIFGKSDGELMGCSGQVMGYGDSTKNGRFVEDNFKNTRTETVRTPLMPRDRPAFIGCQPSQLFTQLWSIEILRQAADSTEVGSKLEAQRTF